MGANYGLLSTHGHLSLRQYCVRCRRLLWVENIWKFWGSCARYVSSGSFHWKAKEHGKKKPIEVFESRRLSFSNQYYARHTNWLNMWLIHTIFLVVLLQILPLPQPSLLLRILSIITILSSHFFSPEYKIFSLEISCTLFASQVLNLVVLQPTEHTCKPSSLWRHSYARHFLRKKKRLCCKMGFL